MACKAGWLVQLAQEIMSQIFRERIFTPTSMRSIGTQYIIAAQEHVLTRLDNLIPGVTVEGLRVCILYGARKRQSYGG